MTLINSSCAFQAGSTVTVSATSAFKTNVMPERVETFATVPQRCVVAAASLCELSKSPTDVGAFVCIIFYYVNH